MGTEGSREYARRSAERRFRKRRRASPSEAEAEAAPSPFLHATPSNESDLRETLAHSRGESTAGLVLGLQRAYGNKAVSGLLQRQKAVDASTGTVDVPSVDAAAEAGERVPSRDASASAGAPSTDVAEGGGGAPTQDASVGGASASPADQPMVRLGSTGATVSQLQIILNSLGVSPPVAVDGVFGPATQSAVASFQREHSLVPDGVVGPKTWGALYGKQPTFATDSGPRVVPRGALVGGETPDEEADDDYIRAAELWDAGDYAGALPFYRRVYGMPEISLYKRASALYYVATCYEYLGQKEQAISAYEELLTIPEVQPNDHAIALERLRAVRTGDEHRGGEDVLKPPPPGAQEEADAQALVGINAAHAAGHAKDYPSALASAERVYALRYASPRFRLLATSYCGLCHQHMGEFDKALDYFEEALGFPADAFEQPVGDAEPVTREDLLTKMRDSRTGQAEVAPNQPQISAAEAETLNAQAHDLITQGQYAASLAILERVYAGSEDRFERLIATIDMGRCNLRLLNFERAASLFLEALAHPHLGKPETDQLQEWLRQARMREVGTHVTAPEPGKAAVPGEVLPICSGDVYFETESAAVNSLGETTIGDFASLINERKKAEPASEIVVGVIGHASSRWRSAPNDQWRQKLNEKLSQARAETVARKLKDLAPTPPFLYTVDASGDQEGQMVTSNRDDNTWFFRSVTIVAIPTSPSAQPTVKIGPS